MQTHGYGRLGSPLKWYGSKVELMDWLRRYMPQHRRYCDVFGGGGAVLFAKTRASHETLNDLDAGVVNFHRVLRDDAKLQTNLQALDSVDAIEPFFNATAPKTANAVERAMYFFINSRCSFAGEMKKGKRYFALRGKNGARHFRTFRNVVRKLPWYSQRLDGVSITNESFEKIIPRFNRPNDLIYCDPTYLKNLRSSRGQNVYEKEMTREQHVTMLGLLRDSKAMVMLSGYEWNMETLEHDTLYSDSLPGWFSTWTPMECRFPKSNPESDKTAYREEVLWMNPLARRTLARHGSDLLRGRAN